MNIDQPKPGPGRPHAALPRAMAALLALVACAGTCLAAETASAPGAAVQILKEAPAKGSVRRGEIVHVDDGSCPAGQVKKITGGNQMTGMSRQVECVKRPEGS
ncbi:hypothetical protein QTH87_14120 [Variovorax sp. J22P168]|uniref:DUF6719 family protein n=1 Tax=Variovorax jilinensis TaxID=3053513 RepID=UPI0025754DC8|nr:DUF6719 family protein [Variovorax sp. J22P168]MDM0013572.1 hypothetical protein [Variovorax sp. J22P168]